tara:strand:+ start:75 stop:530 length:456 start_codon:yes stop_codon:yes gene_type:complete
MRADSLNTNSDSYGKGFDRQPYEELITTKALDVDDSGKIFGLSLAAGFTVTLPALSSAGAGWYCKFVVVTNCTSNDYIITENATYDTNKIIGGINELETDTDDDGPSSTGCTFITLPNATDTVGDYINVWTDGVSWYIDGQTVLDGGAALS